MSNYLLELEHTSSGDVTQNWYRTLSTGENEPIAAPVMKIDDELTISAIYGECIENGVPVNINQYKNLSLGVVLPGRKKDEIISRLRSSMPNCQSEMIGISVNHEPTGEECFQCISGHSESITRGASSERLLVKVVLKLSPPKVIKDWICENGGTFKLAYCFSDPKSGEIPINIGKE